MEIRGGGRDGRSRPIRDQVFLHRALLFDGSNGSDGRKNEITPLSPRRGREGRGGRIESEMVKKGEGRLTKFYSIFAVNCRDHLSE